LRAYLVFLDESGFMLIPMVRRTWAPRGQTPLVRHRYQHNRISAISALSVSPRAQRCGLCAHFHLDNITHVEVAIFLRLLLRHLKGHIILLWDGGPIHRGPDVRAVLSRHSRLHVERLPAYAPEINPDELVWSYLKGQLANAPANTVDELLDDLVRETRRLRRLPALLRAFVVGAELPHFFSS
jgi:transposase